MKIKIIYLFLILGLVLVSVVDKDIRPEFKVVTLASEPPNMIYGFSLLGKLVNEERIKAGVPKAFEISAISKGAALRAVYLGTGGEWSHAGFPEAIRKVLTTTEKVKVGENLAFYSSEAQAINGWLNSPGHKKVMLNPDYKYMGVGRYNNYWVLWFSNKR